MSALLSHTVQPPLLTLLSSACQPALSPLITSHTDSSDPKRSLITVLPDTLSRPRPAKRKWDAQPDEGEYVPVHPPKRGDLADTVIHIQGPRLGETYIQAGSSASLATGTGSSGQSDVTGSPAPVPPLGVQLPWLHFQLKRLGARSMAVEVGVLDLRGVEGVIRCSSFQETPVIHPHRHPPLLHLPMVLPQRSQSTMTEWLDLALNIVSLLPLFQTLPRSAPLPGISEFDGVSLPKKQKRPDVELPNAQFGSISYVRVYANCRLRRIWFSEAGERTMQNMDKREFALVAAEPP